MKIWLRINGLDFSSWFIVWRYLQKAFRNIGVDVPESPFNTPDNDYIEMWWGDPQFWEWSESSCMKVGLALSEHRSIVNPQDAIPNLQQCDLIICPCRSAAQAFYEAPLSMPIKIVPFGVDEIELAYCNRSWDGVLNFLLIGVAQFRKGSWLAVEAFHKAFGDSNDVSLTVASFVNSNMFQKLQFDYRKYSNIKFVGRLPNPKEHYCQNHIVVSPHLAEGWGLTIPEAMSTGMPAIVARCSAPIEYFSDDYGWWIEMSDMYAPVDQCLTGVSGSWRLPDVDSLVEKMLYANTNRKECKEKGDAASGYVQTNLTWRQSAEKMVGIIGDMYDFNGNAGL